MTQRRADYQVVPFSKYRRWMVAAYRSVRNKHMIHGLIEVDVTTPRALLREHLARTGESLSFTAFLAACLAQAVDEHKAVQAYRQGSKHLVVFDDVDVYTVVEHEIAGEKYIIPYVIRAANRKTVRELHDEIRARQAADARRVLRGFQLMLVPTALFRPLLWAYQLIGRRYPRLWKTTVGTVGISSVGMFGKGAGWGIPPATPTTLMLTVGGIGERQVPVDGHMTTREYLCLTLSVDHDIVDGAPAARFAQRLGELIESVYGLNVSAGEQVQAEPIATPAAR